MPKDARRRGSAAGRSETKVARLTRELKEARDRQRATAEVLSAISRSKFELQAILQSVVDTASQLCRADVSVIFRLEGEVYRFAAGYSLDPAYLEHERRTPISPGPGTVVGRAAMSREVVQIEDAWTDPLYEQKAAVKISGGRSMIGVPLMREGEPIGVIGLARTRVDPFTQREIELVTAHDPRAGASTDPEYAMPDYLLVFNNRTMLAVPLLREGIPLGTITLWKTRVEPFTEKQINLITTFADQALIAIENVRLFEAEQQRTRELSKSLEQQTATSEVLSVISRSPARLSRYSIPCWRRQSAFARRRSEISTAGTDTRWN